MKTKLPWFRMYVDFLNDPKIVRLAFEDQRHFIGLLALKSDGALDDLEDDPDLLDRIVAQRLWIDHAIIREVKKRLISAGLIDECWQPIAWQKRQFMSDTDPTATERKRRQRERERNTDVTDASRVTVTNVTRTDTDTDTESEEQKAGTPQKTKSDQPNDPAPTAGAKKRGRKSDPEKTLGVDDLVAEGVGKQHAEDWLKVRKAKKAPLTQTAWDGVKSESAKAGITPAKAVQVSAENSWQGFRASWYAKQREEESRGGGRDAHGRPVAVTSQRRSFEGVDYGKGRVHADFRDIDEAEKL